jgi:ribosomal protein L29
MAIIKAKDAAKLSMKELDEKMKDLRIELIKVQAAGKKVGNPKEMRKTIARLITIKKLNTEKTKK